MKPLLVLRPEPGNGATARRAIALGMTVVQCPLFTVARVAWTAPDPQRFDQLLLTSANALRHGGSQLASLQSLDVLAVGQATADAACAAGFRVAAVGTHGVDALLASVPGQRRLLHLAGADRHVPGSSHAIEAVTIYESTIISGAIIPPGAVVALVHSARAAARLADLATVRNPIVIAAISASVAAACGVGWAAIEIARPPDDGALLALAARLCQD